MALFSQFLTKCPEVINLAIVNNAYIAISAEHRLVAGDQINNCKSSVTKADARRKEKTIAVWPAVSNGIGHGFDGVAIGRALASYVEPAGNSAHCRYPDSSIRAGRGAASPTGSRQAPRQIRRRLQGFRQSTSCRVVGVVDDGGDRHERFPFMALEPCPNLPQPNCQRTRREFSVDPIRCPNHSTLGY